MMIESAAGGIALCHQALFSIRICHLSTKDTFEDL